MGICAGAYAKDVAVVETLACIADQDFGCCKVDVSDSALPVLVGRCASEGPFGVAAAGDYACCADNDADPIYIAANTQFLIYSK